MAVRRSIGLGVCLADCETPPSSLAPCRRACAHLRRSAKSKIPCLSSAKANALCPSNDLSQAEKAPRNWLLICFFSSRLRAVDPSFLLSRSHASFRLSKKSLFSKVLQGCLELDSSQRCSIFFSAHFSSDFFEQQYCADKRVA